MCGIAAAFAYNDGSGVDRAAMGRTCDQMTPARPRRRGHVVFPRRPRRAGAPSALHHRPLRGRRAADGVQWGLRCGLRRARDRVQRRDLQLPGDPRPARKGRPPLPLALGHGGPAPPLGRARRGHARRAARDVRLRAVGRRARRALPRARPLRHQAALRRRRRADAPGGVAGQSAPRRRRDRHRAGPGGPRRVLPVGPRARAAHALPRHPRAPARPLALGGRIRGAARAVLRIRL